MNAQWYIRACLRFAVRALCDARLFYSSRAALFCARTLAVYMSVSVGVCMCIYARTRLNLQWCATHFYASLYMH